MDDLTLKVAQFVRDRNLSVYQANTTADRARKSHRYPEMTEADKKQAQERVNRALDSSQRIIASTNPGDPNSSIERWIETRTHPWKHYQEVSTPSTSTARKLPPQDVEPPYIEWPPQ